MKPGDWVRFCTGISAPKDNGFPSEFPPHPSPPWRHGLLVEYQVWEKIARILCDGKIVSVHASDVQLAHRHPEKI